jgi:hypothetical protein
MLALAPLAVFAVCVQALAANPIAGSFDGKTGYAQVETYKGKRVISAFGFRPEKCDTTGYYAHFTSNFTGKNIKVSQKGTFKHQGKTKTTGVMGVKGEATVSGRFTRRTKGYAWVKYTQGSCTEKLKVKFHWIPPAQAL